jgi:hypothetical protein
VSHTLHANQTAPSPTELLALPKAIVLKRLWDRISPHFTIRSPVKLNLITVGHQAQVNGALLAPSEATSYKLSGLIVSRDQLTGDR